jgi:hypothetical protein
MQLSVSKKGLFILAQENSYDETTYDKPDCKIPGFGPAQTESCGHDQAIRKLPQEEQVRFAEQLRAWSRQAEASRARESLAEFVRLAWPVMEPGPPPVLELAH